MRFWLAAVPAAYFLFFINLTGAGMIGPDEPRYAWIGRDMAQSGDWVTPRLWGHPWFEKPALLYWMTATGFRAGLDEDRAPRLPVAVLSAAFLLFFYFRLRAEFDIATARYSTAVLATSAGWVAFSHAAIVDLPLAATFSAAMLFLLSWIRDPRESSLVWFAALLALSVLAKGLVGPAIVLLVLVCWSCRFGIKVWRALFRWRAIAAFVVLAVPWFALCYARNGRAFVDEFFWRQHFARFAAGALQHHQPVWFFVAVILIGLLPWTPLLALLRRSAPRGDHRILLLWLWAGVVLVFFSLSQDKLPGYVLPALPAVAILAGLALANRRAAVIALPSCAACLALFAPAAAILPAAMEKGLRRAISEFHAPWLLLLVIAALIVTVGMAERAGRRGLAFAAIALPAVAGYTYLLIAVYPVVGRQAGARELWRQAEPHTVSLCLGPLQRNLVYGLNYYAGRVLPFCSEHPEAFRIEASGVVLNRAYGGTPVAGPPRSTAPSSGP